MISVDHVVEIALLLLVSYLFGCTLGYGLHIAVRRSAMRAVRVSVPQAPVVPSSSKPSAARRLAGVTEREALPLPTIAKDTKHPPELPGPRGDKPDDLRKIKGIGAKTEAALHDLGVYHFDQIAAWTNSNLDWLEGRIAIKGRIRREQWVEQAVLLATETAYSRDGGLVKTA